jgi:membrane protein implicated in regulation of membrane protease activity
VKGPSLPPDPRRWLALALLGTAFFMVILDAFLVAVGIAAFGALLALLVFARMTIDWEE